MFGPTVLQVWDHTVDTLPPTHTRTKSTPFRLKADTECAVAVLYIPCATIAIQ